MSISGTLFNALSGMTAARRSAETVSANVSNALTEGYGRRELAQSAQIKGSGGVRIDGVERIVNRAVLADRRNAGSTLGEANVTANFFTSVTDVVGEPGSGYSLADRITALEVALNEASTRPDSETRLGTVLQTMSDLTRHINASSERVQELRAGADSAIKTQVETLNTNLSRIETLNAQIQRSRQADQSVAGILDERQRLIDEISEIVPVRELDRQNGRIALVTPGGEVLLDGKAPVLSFTQTHVVTPYQTLAGGTLSGISINGREINLQREPHSLSGGTLGANLKVRDVDAPGVQSQLDALARDLIERFEDPATDPTRPAGLPGFLNDGGAEFDPTQEVGLADRIGVNELVDPDRFGELWRLRDGIGALVPGNEGDGAGLLRMADALAQLRPTASPNLPSGDRSAATFVSAIHGFIGSGQNVANDEAAYASVRHGALVEREASGGVDTDHEMQRLLLIEQSYAANARVIEAVEAMLDSLMRIR